MSGKYSKASLQNKRVLDRKCFTYKSFAISGKLIWMYLVWLVTEVIQEETKDTGHTSESNMRLSITRGAFSPGI